MRVWWRRFVNSQFAKYFTLLFAPFLIKPSEFANKRSHLIYGRLSAVPLMPLVPAGVFAFAYSQIAKLSAENFDWAGAGLSQSDAIERSQYVISGMKYSSLIFTFIFVYLASGTRWSWHLIMKRFTDKIRRDGVCSGEAPWYFFVVHTSGLALWAALMMIAFSLILGLDFKHPVENLDFLERGHPVIVLFTGLTLSALMKMVSWNSQRMKLEIYRTRKIMRIVTISSFTFWAIIILADILILRIKTAPI